MRRFNPNLTNILEDVGLDTLEPQSERILPNEQKFIAAIVLQFKEGKIDHIKAGKQLRRAATETKRNKPLNVVADFVDILNQSTKTGNVINASALRKLANSLGIKPGALDMLEEEDRAIALRLIHADYKQEISSGPGPGKSPKLP